MGPPQIHDKQNLQERERERGLRGAGKGTTTTPKCRVPRGQSAVSMGLAIDGQHALTRGRRKDTRFQQFGLQEANAEISLVPLATPGRGEKTPGCNAEAKRCVPFARDRAGVGARVRHRVRAVVLGIRLTRRSQNSGEARTVNLRGRTCQWGPRGSRVDWGREERDDAMRFIPERKVGVESLSISVSFSVRYITTGAGGWRVGAGGVARHELGSALRRCAGAIQCPRTLHNSYGIGNRCINEKCLEIGAGRHLGTRFEETSLAGERKTKRESAA
ncbi:hypothetical protein B0H13DRAFT_2287405 [Mycena leptocephala]|nr:hypothetical protein B0H13DRAFT_2287405 [Mycena leptocephala]